MIKYITLFLISLFSLSLYNNLHANNLHADFQTIPILAYHSFSEPDTSQRKLRINVPPKKFLEQLQYLADNNYKVLPLEKFVEALNKKLPLPQKSVVITIDDGVESVYSVAFPYLNKFNFCATLFLTTNFVNKSFTWEMLNELQNSGVIDIQGHTKTHHYCSLVRDLKTERKTSYLKRLEMELLESKNIIEEKLNNKVKYLAYPYGKYDQFVIEKAKKYGYKALLTFHGGTNTLSSSPFNINRQAVYGDFDLKKFISLLNIGHLKSYYLNPPLATYTFYKKPKIFAMIEEPINLNLYQILFKLDNKILPYNYDQKSGKLSLVFDKPLIQGGHFIKIQLVNKNTCIVEKEVGWVFTRQGIPFTTIKGIKLFLKIFLSLMLFGVLVIITYKIRRKNA
ncbi:MAG: polysaccharide deacetylase family protein [bacterium]|nr:polysaccharide deacetylase family protein [bacterium]